MRFTALVFVWLHYADAFHSAPLARATLMAHPLSSFAFSSINSRSRRSATNELPVPIQEIFEGYGLHNSEENEISVTRPSTTSTKNVSTILATLRKGVANRAEKDVEQKQLLTRSSSLSSLDEKKETTALSSVDSSNHENEYPSTPTFRECMAFAIPALGIYICSPLMSLIDAAFVGRLSSSTELAALGPASSISDSAPLPLLFLSIAATNLIAKSFAQKDHATSSRVSRTSIGMGSICGLILGTLLYIFANPISVAFCGGPTASAAQSLAPSCSKYVAIRALALPFVVISTIAQAICIGTKDTRTPMVSVALAGICNLLGDLVLVKYLRQGIVGAAWATSASQIVSAGLLLRVLKKRGLFQKEQTLQSYLTSTPLQQQQRTQQQQNQTSTLATVKELLAFVPFLFIMVVKMSWHNSGTATAASLGGVSAAAHTALLSVTMVCMVLGDVGSSLSQAFLPAFEGTITTDSTKSPTSTFNLDAALPTIKQLLKCTLSISASVVVIAGIIIGFFGGQITNDPAVLAEMRKTLPWIMGTLSFHGSAVTLEGLLLSRKKFPQLSACYSVLAVTVAAFSVATRKFSLGLAGVWACYVWFCAARAVAFSALGGLLRPRLWLQKIRNRNQGEARVGTQVA